MAINLFDGPIPGENFTSDTKNYPWHRAPEIDDIDDAIEASLKQLSTREGAYAILTSLQSGITVADFASVFVISGVGSGKWTPDFAILLAGPIAHIVQIMADGYGIDYQMGIDDEPIPTAAYYKEMKELDTGRVLEAAEEAREQIEEVKEKAVETRGFMSPLLQTDEELD